MAAWQQFSPADFDAKRADKRAARQARQAAETGQSGLFFVATPERESRPAGTAEQLDGQADLFGEDDAPVIQACAPNSFGFCRTCGRDMQDTGGE